MPRNGVPAPDTGPASSCFLGHQDKAPDSKRNRLTGPWEAWDGLGKVLRLRRDDQQMLAKGGARGRLARANQEGWRGTKQIYWKNDLFYSHDPPQARLFC